ncbi:MAG: hypothetical protein IT379_15860, partial [Deltaproteobacteria bacterium]|nr:hypothetical protein [Deltaproteobacteria bacterium]
QAQPTPPSPVRLQPPAGPYPGAPGYTPYAPTAPTLIHERGIPALWITGLGVFGAAYIVPPIVALGIEGSSRALEIPLAGWIVFLANQDCPETEYVPGAPGESVDAGSDQECTLAAVGVVWSGVLQLAGLGLFLGGVLARRTVRVVAMPPAFAVAPMAVPGGGGIVLAWR